MTSFLLSKMVEKYHLVNRQKVNTKEIQEMAMMEEITVKEILRLFQVSRSF